jgi:hypothetical protein
MAGNDRSSERGAAGDKVHSGSDAFGRVVRERDGTADVSREASNSDSREADAGVSTEDIGTNSFTQQPREASSTGLERSVKGDDAPSDTRGEPAGGRSQQGGGILREEDRGPGASSGVDDTPLA